MAIKPITATPDNGGRLITRRTDVTGGFYNYSIKRDWRRDMGDEIRAEGHVHFHPNQSLPIGNQHDPTDQEYSIALFENGGFENDYDGDGIPDGWSVTVSGSTFSMDTADVYAGTRSAKFASSVAGNSGYIQSESFLPVGDERVWQLTLSAKAGSAGHIIQVTAYWYDADQVALSTTPSTSVMSEAASTVWTQYIKTITPPTDAVYGKIRLTGKVAGETNVSSAWFDGVDLVEKDRSVLDLTHIGQMRMPNGRLLTFAATKTTIYRFVYDGDEPYVGQTGTGLYAEEDYYVEDYAADNTTGDYVEDDYVDGAEGFWDIIGTGFSLNGNRWEMVPVGPGYAVFNNGVDLPVTYHYPDAEVKPIYELRESGVVKVGSIAEYNGALFGFDVAQLRSDRFDDIFAHERPAVTTTAKQYGSFRSAPHKATSAYGYAINFDGTNDYVNVPDSASLDGISTELTVEGWVKLSSTSAGGGTIGIASRQVNGGGDILWSLSLKADPDVADPPPYPFTLLIFTATTSAGAILNQAEYAFATNVWYHVAVTFDGARAKMFVNGEIVDDAAESGTIAVSDQVIKIGNRESGSGNPFVLSEVRVWSEARTQTEINDNMASDVTGTSNLVGLWMMDEGSGGTTADASGNSNTGTLTNGPTWVTSTSDSDAYIEMSPVSSSSLTNDGAGLATFTATTAHGLETGDLITVTGSSTSDYNVTEVACTVLDLYRFTYSMAVIGAGTSGGTPVVRAALFEDGHESKTIRMSNGLSAVIQNVVSGIKVKVDRSVESLDGENRTFRIVSTSVSALSGTVAKNGTTAVTGTSTAFTTELSTGQLIRIGTTEEVRQVVAIASDTSLTVDSAFAGTESGVTGYRVSDYTVLASLSVFDSDMVGRKILFDDGQSRTITAYNNEKRVDVDDHRGVVSQEFSIENITAYDAITNGTYFDRIRYRAIWSALDEPYTFNASPLGTIEAGSIRLELQYQTRSIERDMRITIAGAGVNGANLSTTIRSVLDNHTTVLLDDPAVTSVEDAAVQRTDSIGSIVGYTDLADESSAILCGKELSDVLIIYKEKMVFFAVYTGNAASPFAFRRRYEGTKTPYYRFSLTNVTVNGSEFHFYRGRNSFYAFDLTRQIPIEIPELEDVEDVFTGGDIEDINDVFAFDNPITKEWFLCFPSSGDDAGICYDYMFKTVRTTSAEFTAGCQAERVSSGADDYLPSWVLLATSGSKVSIYGKTDQPDPVIGDRTEVFTRNGADYDSVLRSSMWGSRTGDVTVVEYLPELSSNTEGDVSQMTLNFYAIENPARGGTLLFSETIELPAEEPLTGLHYEHPMFQDELIVRGAVSAKLSARSVWADGINTHSHSNRQR